MNNFAYIITYWDAAYNTKQMQNVWLSQLVKEFYSALVEVAVKKFYSFNLFIYLFIYQLVMFALRIGCIKSVTLRTF